MMVPESIRSVPRPTNTVVVDSGHNGALRYAVRERAGLKYDRSGRAADRVKSNSSNLWESFIFHIFVCEKSVSTDSLSPI